VFASQASVLHNLAHQVGHVAVAQAVVQLSISTEDLGSITVFERKGCLWDKQASKKIRSASCQVRPGRLTQVSG
jgi:hypothetical protein